MAGSKGDGKSCFIGDSSISDAGRGDDEAEVDEVLCASCCTLEDELACRIDLQTTLDGAELEEHARDCVDRLRDALKILPGIAILKVYVGEMGK